MEEKEKYYTPEIEEFHVGFEFEYKRSFFDGTVKTKEQFDSAPWIKEECNSIFYLAYVERALKGKNAESGLCGVRVKHLDKEDIEELGWKYREDLKSNLYEVQFSIEYPIFLKLNHDKTIDIEFIEKQASINKIRVVKGLKVKNKSELKRLMQQLNIKE